MLLITKQTNDRLGKRKVCHSCSSHGSLYRLVLFPLTATLSWRSLFIYRICAAVMSRDCTDTKTVCMHNSVCSLSLSLSLSLYIYIYIYIYIYDSLQFSGYVIFFKQWAGKRKKDSPSLLVRLFVCLRVAVRQLLDQLCLNLEWMFASGSHFASFLLKLSLVRGNFRMPRYKESLYCCSVILWGCLLLQSFLKLEGIKTPAVRNLRWF